MHIDVPPGVKRLAFAVAMDPAVYAGTMPICGAGADFTMEARDSGGTITQLFERYIDPKHIIAQRHWIDESVDISRWAGSSVDLLLSTAPGPEYNLCADWAVWGGGSFSPLSVANRPHSPFTLEYRDGDTAIYRFDRALPRVSIFEDAKISDTTDSALSMLVDPGFDIARSTIITPESANDRAALAGVDNPRATVRAGQLRRPMIRNMRVRTFR